MGAALHGYFAISKLRWMTAKTRTSSMAAMSEDMKGFALRAPIDDANPSTLSAPVNSGGQLRDVGFRSSAA